MAKSGNPESWGEWPQVWVLQRTVSRDLIFKQSDTWYKKIFFQITVIKMVSTEFRRYGPLDRGMYRRVDRGTAIEVDRGGDWGGTAGGILEGKVLSWLSCSGCPVVLFWLSLYGLSFPDCPTLALLFLLVLSWLSGPVWLTYPGFHVMSCYTCLVQIAVFRVTCSACPVMPVLFWLSWSGSPFLAVRCFEYALAQTFFSKVKFKYRTSV